MISKRQSDGNTYEDAENDRDPDTGANASTDAATYNIHSRCHEIDYPPELAYTRGYSISIPIYPPPRKITTDG